MRELIFVSGLSGAGKSVALTMLEDLGFFCIDNLPLPLIHALNPAELSARDERYKRIAVLVDARASEADIQEFPAQIDRLRAGNPEFVTRLLYLTADDAAILRRYSETRRKHPLTGASLPLAEAIAKERRLLKPIAAHADLTLDTSRLNLHQLRERIGVSLSPAEGGKLTLLFQSFGYKYGLPNNLDQVFDVRCLPNPYWEPTLKPHSGHDRPVIEWLEASPLVTLMFDDICGYLERWLPRFAEQDRSYVTVGIGCTGGRHRSVYLVERLAEHFGHDYPAVLRRHTELP